MEEGLKLPAAGQEGEQRAGGTDPAGYLEQIFELTPKDYSQYSPLTMAYLGDDVYDTIIRTVAVKRGNRQAAKLNKTVTRLVNAGTQADLMRAILPHLTEEEAAVFRRGKNSKPYHTAKHAARNEYLVATGFETLVGYLYLQGRMERLLDLIRLGLKETGNEL